MSVKAVSAVLDTRGLSPAERVILIILGDVADNAGYSWRSLATVADLAELNKRHVRRLCLDLVSRGLLDRVYAGGGRSRPALYRVLPLFLDDDENSPSRLRYESRFAWTKFGEKGDKLTPMDKSETRTPTRVKGDTHARKGGSGDPPIHHEPSRVELDDAGATVAELPEDPVELIPREDGEPIKDYLERAFLIRMSSEPFEVLDERSTS